MTADRQPEYLRPVPDLPVCPHCGSPHVTSFKLDWIEVPDGSWVCVECKLAFIPEAWKAGGQA